MTTPNKKAIVEKAKELFFQNAYRNGIMNPNTPELNELSESGYVQLAMSELMSSEKRKHEHEFIDFAQDFAINLPQFYESNGLILGSRHTGKSDLAMMVSEKAMEENTIVIVFDPSLDWIARSNIPRVMKVEHGITEIPESSIIYDISLCSPNQAQRIVEGFSKRLFESQAKTQDRKQYLVILEESHMYFFEGSLRSKRMQNSVKMLSVGRNVDIAVLLISQFASMLDKFAIKHAMSQSWYGFTREPNDLKYLRMILGEQAKELTKLEDGQFLYLSENGISKIQIERFESNVAKIQIAIPEPKPIEPIKRLVSKNETIKAISSIVIGLMWLIAIIIGSRGMM